MRGGSLFKAQASSSNLVLGEMGDYNWILYLHSLELPWCKCNATFFTTSTHLESSLYISSSFCFWATIASTWRPINNKKKPMCIVLNWHFWSKMEFLYTFFVAGEWVECSVWGDFRHARYAMSCDDICRWIAKLNLPKWMLCKQTSLRMIPENLAPKKFRLCSFYIYDYVRLVRKLGF